MKTILATLSMMFLAACGASTGSSPSDTQSATLPAASLESVTTLVPSAPFIVDMKIDATTLYWTNNAGEVWSVPLAGGATTQLATLSDRNEFPALALGPDTIYLANGTQISSLPKAGGQLALVATTQGRTNTIMLSGSSLYWSCSDTNPTVANSGTISVMPVAGGAVRTLAANLSAPMFLAADATSVYWADMAAGTISSVPLAGGSPTVLVSNQAGLNGLAVRGGRLYWSNYSGPVGGVVGHPPRQPSFGDGTLNSIPTQGGTVTVLAKSYNISNIAVDDAYAYWADGHAGTISRTPLAGGASNILESNGDWPYAGPVVDGQNLYYATHELAAHTFAIRKVAKAPN